MEVNDQTLTSNSESTWELVRRLFALSWRYRLGCIKVLVLQTSLLTLTLFGLGLTGIALDVMRQAVDAKAPLPKWPFHFTPPPGWTPMQTIDFIAMSVLGLAAVRGLLDRWFRVEQNQLVQAEIVVQMRTEIYDKMQRMSFRFFDANASSSIINRVTGDVQAVRMFVDQVLMQSVIVMLSLTAYMIYMLSIHARLTIVCLITTPMLGVLAAKFSQRVHPAYRKNRDLVDSMIQRLAENIRGIQVVKAFAREQDEIEKFRRANETVRLQKQWIFKQVAMFNSTTGFFNQANLIVLLAYGGYLAIDGKIPIGTGLVVFAGILQQFAGQISSISAIASSMQESLTGARRVFEVLDAPLEIEAPASPVRLRAARGHVLFENLWFDHGHDPVLKNINFEVRPGQSVAVFGATGSGKSALLSLIPRFYDPTQGRILVDGIDLRKMDLDDLRGNVGLVFQESFLFSTTIAANIAFGHPEASREQIERAARIAAAHDFISEMPKGYDTVLGEGGIGLSGGQRQRLAIARAVLLEPAILLLDDPTAAIDQGTEYEIIEAMNAAMASRTTFLVTHRPSMLRRADFIVVLEHGELTQIGTHDELILRGGYYAQVAAMQIGDEAQTQEGAP
jgi:ATP-binding cassette subfamily B protein